MASAGGDDSQTNPLERYKVSKLVGRGNFGMVHLCRSVEDGRQYVLKRINLNELTGSEREGAQQEVSLLKRLRHPCIVSYRDSWMRDNTLHLVMNYCDGGDLHHMIKRAKGNHFPEETILEIFVQIAWALQYCHNRKIVHRDLKSQNIFLSGNNRVKLGDFGIARILAGTNELAMSVVGTPYSMSPEVCENKPYGFASDIWSLGCVLYEMCVLKHAFDANNLLGLVWKIVQEEQPPIPDFYSDELRGLANAMLHKDPVKRPSINEIMKLPFIKQQLLMLSRKKTAKLSRKLFNRPPSSGSTGMRTPTYTESKTPSRNRVGPLMDFDRTVHSPKPAWGTNSANSSLSSTVRRHTPSPHSAVSSNSPSHADTTMRRAGSANSDQRPSPRALAADEQHIMTAQERRERMLQRKQQSKELENEERKVMLFNAMMNDEQRRLQARQRLKNEFRGTIGSPNPSSSPPPASPQRVGSASPHSAHAHNGKRHSAPNSQRALSFEDHNTLPPAHPHGHTSSASGAHRRTPSPNNPMAAAHRSGPVKALPRASSSTPTAARGSHSLKAASSSSYHHGRGRRDITSAPARSHMHGSANHASRSRHKAAANLKIKTQVQRPYDQDPDDVDTDSEEYFDRTLNMTLEEVITPHSASLSPRAVSAGVRRSPGGRRGLGGGGTNTRRGSHSGAQQGPQDNQLASPQRMASVPSRRTITPSHVQRSSNGFVRPVRTSSGGALPPSAPLNTDTRPAPKWEQRYNVLKAKAVRKLGQTDYEKVYQWFRQSATNPKLQQIDPREALKHELGDRGGDWDPLFWVEQLVYMDSTHRAK